MNQAVLAERSGPFGRRYPLLMTGWTMVLAAAAAAALLAHSGYEGAIVLYQGF
jgi:hypothetical protein